ncbi:MAG TPA: phosphate-starvation-inducible PsiE family protein [Streptosporangiaceae bacterium]
MTATADQAPDAGPAALASADGAEPHEPKRAMGISIWILEHSQDVVTVLIGVVLIFLAAALLISGIVEFASSAHPIAESAKALLDRALFVLILIEIVHTVVLSLQAHRLIAQPFVVVGLVAVIRRILLVLSSAKPTSPAELGLLIGMVAVFVAGLIAVSRFERRADEHDQI